MFAGTTRSIPHHGVDSFPDRANMWSVNLPQSRSIRSNSTWHDLKDVAKSILKQILVLLPRLGTSAPWILLSRLSWRHRRRSRLSAPRLRRAQPLPVPNRALQAFSRRPNALLPIQEPGMPGLVRPPAKCSSRAFHRWISTEPQRKDVRMRSCEALMDGASARTK